MRANDYTSLAALAAVEIDSLARAQRLMADVEDGALRDVLEPALRGMTIRTAELACVILSALADDDLPKESVQDLQLRLYGQCDHVGQGTAATAAG